MKTNYLVCLFFAAMMALAACTEEKIVYIEKSHGIELQPGEGIIELSVANALTTRAARPVVSSEATNNVNRVMFKFFNHDNAYTGTSIIGVYDADGKVYYDEESGETSKGIKVVSINGGSLLVFGNNEEGSDTYSQNALDDLSNLESGLILKLDGLPGNTKNFKIVAYGYNQPEGTATDLGGVLNLNDALFTYGVNSEGSAASGVVNSRIDEEIFAGYVEVEVNIHNKLVSNNYTLTLERQVAGILAYFYNAPTFVDNQRVEKITVSTGVLGLGIKFPASLLEKDDYNGILYEYFEQTDLLTFDMKQASNYNDVTGSGQEITHYTFTNGCLLANEVANDYVGLDLNLEPEDSSIKNVLFGGCFLCPFEQHQSENNNFHITNGGTSTLNIVYYTIETKDGKDTYKVIKAVPLKLASDITGYDPYYYDIRRNHFYSMGTIDYTNDGEGNEPMDIDPGSGYDELKLFLNDAWELISLTNQSEN